MEVSPQDPSLMAMDLSKGFSVHPLSRGHTEAMDLGKKPEWYHRRLPSCSPEISSPYRSRASSSYNSQPGLHCRNMEQGPEALSNYMNSTLAPGLYPNGNLWHAGFSVPESSGGEESDSGSDVIFLVSSAKEPLLCSSFLQDSMRHIVEPLSPAVSSLEEERGCYHLPQPLSSPSPDSSDSEESSDSSVDIPIHHARPVVLLSDLNTVYTHPAESLVDISSDDSDIIEVSVTSKNKKTVSCKKSLARETPPQSEDEKAQPRRIRRSTRIRRSVSEISQYICSESPRSLSRYSLRRQAKNDVVGIYNESCDSDDMMEYEARFSSSDTEESASQENVSQRVSSGSEESDAASQTDRKSPQREQQPRCKAIIVNERSLPPFVKQKKQELNRHKKAQVLQSSMKLGRSGSESGGEAALLCCLCGQTANATGLGDLHGPYHPTGPSLLCKTEQKEEGQLNASRSSVNSSDNDCDGVKSLLEGDNRSLPKVPLRVDEGWIHGDCGIWSTGVFLVGGKLYGLEEAAQLAQETKCSACQQTGAIMGCFQKGCHRSYHYSCAIQSGCVLNEDNFSIRCPEHKKKPLTSVNKRHKR
ncbi:Transcription factor 20 [Dissostichus eleginoides]|uniref:Transcription factor 20 n=1 Tax=Dissostichus eleginoides TaxID=100907 RepID=A0AAD9B5Q4_DISEL|nr:Transcription factor 20 [Dissostichus eleginoides]